MRDTMFEKILSAVQKPTRYIGGEYGSVYKNPKDVKIRFCMCFPDLYEVGMSHLGMRILYHLKNTREDTFCERAFMPWDDMMEELEKNDMPLFALESRDPLCAFDMLGFSLQYEMSYTNVLEMLRLSRIPLKSADRGEAFPFICAGGSCALNPEPLADFIDFFLIGEGEELNMEVLDAYGEWKDSGKPKSAFLETVAGIEGVYVPSFYQPAYDGEKVLSITPVNPCAPAKVKKRIIENMDDCFFPETQIVPYGEIVHDRISLEMFRGCIRGCRFCQAGMIYRPVRERSPEKLLSLAKSLMESTGYEEISLLSLSTSDYTELPFFTEKLLDMTEEKKISLALPSLRIDNFSMELMQRIQKVRKTGLTFAPEAGTQRMRDVINKGITEEDVLNSARIAFGGGYKNIKLYFMIGLPFETMEDVAGIPLLAKKVVDTSFELPKVKGEKPVQITASVSSFVPKPHTPFQWEAQNTAEELREKQKVLCETVRSKRMTINYHESKLSVLEGVFARGDRRLGKVLEKAVELGCRFDGWSEHFDFEKWQEAFIACGVKMETYTRERDIDEFLPWEVIDCGVSKAFLKKEREKAEKGEVTPNCRAKCSGCGASSWKVGVCHA
ncbi:MAG: TIGR03960 family B12-binding radical SAM protein [Clostridia bacterium]|nr:TIGR03960 family B12-binding radical SAM protein [Clostridia bacterium]